MGTSDVHRTGGCHRAQTHAQRLLSDAGGCSAHGSRGRRAAAFRSGTAPTLQPLICWQLLCAWQQTEDFRSLRPVLRARCGSLYAAVVSVGQIHGCGCNSRRTGCVFDFVARPAGKAEGLGTDSEQALHTLLTVLSDFLQDAKVACRRYTDDLLEACLELLLAAPAAVMPAQVCACTCALLQARPFFR